MSMLENLWLIEKLCDGVAYVLCNGTEFTLPVSALPANIREGDVLEPRLQNGELLRRKDKIIKLFDSLKDN